MSQLLFETVLKTILTDKNKVKNGKKEEKVLQSNTSVLTEIP